MSRALEGAKSALREVQARFGSVDMVHRYIDDALIEIARLEVEEAEALAAVDAAALTPQALDILRQIHSRGLHGKTLAETTRMILSVSLSSYLPEGFRWCEPASGPKVGLRKVDDES